MKNTTPRNFPPKWLYWLAGKLCAPHLREELLGDLQERYALKASRKGDCNAFFFFLRETFGLLRLSILKRKPSPYRGASLFSSEMLRTHFKVGSRVLVKNSGYSFIHLVGLSIGLWACMMVATVVIDAFSYDKQWSRSKDIYRILTVDEKSPGLLERMSSSHESLGAEFEKLFPEVESWSSFSSGTRYFKANESDNEGIKTRHLEMDTTAWKMLDFKVIAGSPQHFQQGNTNIVLSKSFAEKLAPGKDLTGQLIYDIPSYGDKGRPYLVTGVIDDLPYNTHLRADVIQLRQKKIAPYAAKGFFMFSENYILLKPKTDVAAFSAKVNKWYRNLNKENVSRLELQPMEDIYLHSDFADNQIKGEARTIYIFSGVAALLLFIACVNFVNLSTARAFARLKETGVRRLLSGSRGHLVVQLLTETLLLFGISTVFAAIFYMISLEKIEQFLSYKLVHTFVSDPALAGMALAAVCMTALVTGLYPAWLVSGFKPANTLRGILTNTFGQNTLRKSLVVVQFGISIIVLLSTIVVWKQLSLMESKDLGYNKKNLLAIESVSWDGKSDAFKNELLNMPGVEKASIARWMPTKGGGYMIREVRDPANTARRIKVWYISGDTDLAETIGWKLSGGRMFRGGNSVDALNADSLQEKDFAKYEEAMVLQSSLITESAVKILGINKLNEKIANVNTMPVGIIKDFNNEALYEPIKPTIILADRSPQYGGMLIRTQPGAEMQVVNAVNKLWKTFYPSKLLKIESVEVQLNAQYAAESRMQQLFMFFSGLTILLSALGIFGLVVQAAEQRTREVGIRKVLGASVSGIVGLLSKDFVGMALISIVLASPIGWYGLDAWLENYPYRTGVDWWIFAVTGAIILLVTLATVGIQAFRAAIVNPVKSLRSE